MVPFSHLKNALRGDHLADFLQQSHERGSPVVSTFAKRAVECRAEYTAALAERYKDEFERMHAMLTDDEHKVTVHVDALLRGTHIRQLCSEEFEVADHQLYPLLVQGAPLKLRKGKCVLLNDASSLMIKAKLYFAARSLGTTQGYVIGPDEQWAVVDFARDDADAADKAVSAAQWAHAVAGDTSDWTLSPPSRVELYPNMRAETEDSAIKRIKKSLALENKEITLVRGVTPAHRARALALGIDRWDHPDLDADMLGINGKKSATLVDTILQANRAADTPVCRDNIPNTCAPGDVFIDIETLGALCKDLPDMVFMIGIGFGANEFECIVAKAATLLEERRAVVVLLERLEELGAKRLLHWAPYEVNVFRKLEQRHGLSILHGYEWLDMCEELQTRRYCPKNAFSFSLKSVAPAMHRNGMIDTIWDSECTDGMTAMENAYEAYASNNLDALADIERYNRVDVITTMEIWRYLASIGVTL